MEKAPIPLTVLIMSKRLNISTDATHKRLDRAGRNPYMYIGATGVYTEDDFDAIKEGGKRGRPWPEKKTATPQKAKTKKKKK